MGNREIAPVPLPTVMPVDREVWATQLNLSNFVNAYYQYRDLKLCKGNKVLVVGPGQGLDVEIFKWKGYQVTTFDIDNVFKPDHLGSVHDMRIFSDHQFDIVIASHILEHLAEPYLDMAIAELARVARYALVYLPVAGRHGQLRFSLGIKNIKFDLSWDIFNFFNKPDGKTLRYCEGQHYWELGMKGYRRRDVKARLSKHFDILSAYRNQDWLPSFNFVLKANPGATHQSTT